MKTLAVFLVLSIAATIDGAKFDTPIVSWSGSRVTVQCKTDLSEGSGAMIAVTGRTAADTGMRGQFLGRVKGGYLVGTGIVHPVEDTLENHINAKPGHYLVVIMMDDGGLYTFEFGPKS
jgi:hypothetical protein